jgi:CheY-like chemotaxis protein
MMMVSESDFLVKHMIRSATQKQERHPINILIIDDDIDSALRVQTVFTHLGCQTTCALNWHEAAKKICALKPDIIILDWMLDHQIDAGDVVKHCTKMFQKFDGERRNRAMRRPKIITYSSLGASEIELPDTPYFDHLDHWQKPVRQRDLLSRVLGLLGKIGR